MSNPWNWYEKECLSWIPNNKTYFVLPHPHEIWYELISPWTKWQPFRRGDDVFICIFMNEKFCNLTGISRKFVPKCPIDSKSVLIQVMTWRRAGDKPLPESVVAQFTDSNIRHTGDCTAKFIPNMFYGVAVWRSWRLLHLGDVTLLKEIKDYSSTVRCGVIVLVAVVIPEMLPGKWH